MGSKETTDGMSREPADVSSEPRTETGRDSKLAAGGELEAFERASLTERQLLERARDEALEERSRATAWLMLVGVGPAAVIAIALALFIEGSEALAWAFAMLGAAMLVLKLYRADKKVRELEKLLEDPMDGS